MARSECGVSEGLRVRPGRPLPLGVDDCCDGFNFAVFSRYAERIELLIFESATSPEPLLVVDLADPRHRTGDIWHALVDALPWGATYAYRVRGPWAPERGHRFDASALLLDPYALAVAGSAGSGGRSLLVGRRFDWDGTTRPQIPWHHTVIYETHVRGLTIDPSATCTHPGTFLGLVEKVARPQPEALCVLFNAGEASAEFRLPSPGASGWRLCLDTGTASPGDIFAEGTEPPIAAEGQYRLIARSLAVLASR